jgi:hypothetical protein
MRFSNFFLSSLIAVTILPAKAEERGPLYRLDFTDGTLANTGSVGGSAEDNPEPAGSAQVQITQNDGTLWEALFEPSPNGSAGPSLLLPDSAGRLGLGGPEDALTFSVWIKWNGPDKHPDSKQPIVWKPLDATGPGWALSVTESGILRFDWKKADGGWSHRLSEEPLPAGEWHQIGVIWKNDDTAGIEFYLDGSPVKPTVGFTGGGPLQTGEEPIVVGANPGGHMPLNGSLRSLRLYDRALSSEEMAALAADAPK